MKQQHQAQLESKLSELSTEDTLIMSKSCMIQNLQAKLGQVLGSPSGSNNPTVFTPGVKLTFSECVNIPISTGGLDQGTVVGKDVYFVELVLIDMPSNTVSLKIPGIFFLNTYQIC